MALSLEKFKKAQEFTLKNRQELDEKIDEKVSEIDEKMKELELHSENFRHFGKCKGTLKVIIAH